MDTAKRIYVSMDSLFDLRMGTMNIINSEFALEVTTRKPYYTRQQDIFKGLTDTLSNESYMAVLKKYPDVVLRNSLKTKIDLFLNTIVSMFIKQSVTAPVNHEYVVDVNLYPFTLDEAEKAELIRLLDISLGSTMNINLINVSMDDLTVDFVCDKYRYMIMYEYHTWLNIHTDALKSKSLINTMIYVPKLYFDRLPTAEELKEIKDMNKDPFEVSRQALSPLVSVDYLPVSLYCACTPINDDKMIQ